MYLSGNSTLSSLVLNLNTVSLHTMSSLKVSHLLISRIQRTGKDVQAGLRLCCSQTPEDRFPRVEAQIITISSKKIMNVMKLKILKQTSKFSIQRRHLF